jgi:uncharacterized protein
MTINPIYFLILIPALLAWFAQARVRKVYEINEAKPNRQQVNGLDAARRLLAFHYLKDVSVETVPGKLSDHYDPASKTMRLSNEVATSRSITSLGIVAHEVGHAIQDAEGYHFMRLRTSMASRISVAAQWSSFVFLGGILFRIPVLMVLAGVFMFAMLLFTLVTLPVERDASKRALKSLEQTGLVAGDEAKGVRQVLNSAAFTYLASLGQRLASFLFFAVVILLARGEPQL